MVEDKNLGDLNSGIYECYDPYKSYTFEEELFYLEHTESLTSAKSLIFGKTVYLLFPNF